jgi:tetratricopeptide (TPR) repeat protein
MRSAAPVAPPAAAPAPAPADGAAAALPDGAIGVVVPFWQRMPRLFLFPLQRPPLLRNLAVSALSCVLACVVFAQIVSGASATPAETLAGVARAFGWMLLICGGGTLYIAGFCFEVIERSSSGYLDSRAYPPQEAGANWSRPLKMFLVLVLVPVFLGILGHFGPRWLGVLLLIAWALLLPASVMVMALTDSFADAVNPARCLQTALAIGAPYLLLFVYLVLLNFGFNEVLGVVLRGAGTIVHVAPAPAAQAGGHAAAVAPEVSVSLAGLSVMVFTVVVVFNYFFILTCALIGYAMYQYSDALGIAVVGPGEVRGPVGAASSAAAHARRQRETLIGKMVAAGEIREAIELLNAELRERPSDLSLHVRLHKLLVHEGSGPMIETHAARYLELLLAAGSRRDALELWTSTRSRFPGFTMRDPVHWLALADEALAAGKPDQAAEIIRGFDKRFPADPRIAEAYVIGARVLLQGEQPAQAQRLLKYVVAHYPATPAALEAKRYLARFA